MYSNRARRSIFSLQPMQKTQNPCRRQLIPAIHHVTSRHTALRMLCAFDPPTYENPLLSNRHRKTNQHMRAQATQSLNTNEHCHIGFQHAVSEVPTSGREGGRNIRPHRPPESQMQCSRFSMMLLSFLILHRYKENKNKNKIDNGQSS